MSTLHQSYKPRDIRTADDQIAPHDSCRMVISGINARIYDRMSYYDAWHAGVILAAMCARTGKAGLFKHIGEYQAR